MTRRHILLALRYSSQIGGAASGDMFIAASVKIRASTARGDRGERFASHELSELSSVYKTFSFPACQ